jgi:carbamoyltransferase
MTRILGISAFYHDSAAALLVDGEIVAAAQEERFTRKKHDADFPRQAVRFCLDQAGIGAGDLDFVAFYDKPFLKFERLLSTYLTFAPTGFPSFLRAMPVWLKQKLFLPREIRRGLDGQFKKRPLYTGHHESHAASAFFPSPFDEAAILTLDGVGEWATASFGVGRGNRIALSHSMRFPHSLGLLYSAFTYYCGFTVNSGEYKLMGLAPYGQPKYVTPILEHLIDLKEDGSLRLDLSYFNYCQGLSMTSPKFHALFGGEPRKPDTPLTERDMDIAASIQAVTEEVMLRCARKVHRETGMKNLCLAGGVALNCVGNGRILREGPFDDVWIQPAAGDAGGALGAAMFVWHQLLDKAREPRGQDCQHGSLLGSSYSDEEIGRFLAASNAVYERLDDEALTERIADEIANGSVIGWFQGRMEYGPRALGSRSILGDARSDDMATEINLKVKFREGFRPFAPAVLREHASDYFELEPGRESPYMLLVAPVQKHQRVASSNGESDGRGIARLKERRSVIPAVTHVDYSARMQTVDRERHGRFRSLLEAFWHKTGCPTVINTSFNLGWDPIVSTPEDAYATFMSSNIDVLSLGNHVVTKRDQPVHTAAEEHEDFDAVLRPMMQSPCHAAEFTTHGGMPACSVCGRAFGSDGGIRQMFWPHEGIDDPSDVTERVKAFYEETPFPNYDDHESVRSLIDKSRQRIYAHSLDRSIPYNSTVLEVGCGTGQLSNYLGISFRRVIGTDLCLNSLRLGERFRSDHDLNRVWFMQMNLFRPCFKPGQFDVVLCNGVLHHTADPLGGFRGLVPLVKPGGHLVVGLYNRYGRLMTDLRRGAFRLTGGRARWIDPILRKRDARDDPKSRAWFFDQYRHPHESKHTTDEVLGWFEQTGLELVRGVPSLAPAARSLNHDTDLFQPEPRGSVVEHVLAQLEQAVAPGNREGGFFIMIGRRPEG